MVDDEPFPPSVEAPEALSEPPSVLADVLVVVVDDDEVDPDADPASPPSVLVEVEPEAAPSAAP